ncbi:hypothetical protein AGLY_005191 [Aphis glycines]|uniref:Uncharacterized protein n=2 Tax=Aphis glycines TaxID=307491 RepID=A0A6G0TYB8_APHGL|nr:hypothetical protein AGLY_005191 [Aphis glycines]
MDSKINIRRRIYLIGASSHQLVGCKLPSNKQVLSVLFFNIREVKLSLRESARLVIDETLIFWQKARIPTREVHNCVPMLEELYNTWRSLQKNSSRRTNTQIKNENEFVQCFDELFDIAHADALNMMTIDIDKQFLITQRQKGRPGAMMGVDWISQKREFKRSKQLEESEKKRKLNENKIKYILESVELCSSSDTEESLSDNCELAQNIQDNTKNSIIMESCEDSAGPSTIKRGRTVFINDKLVTVLDRCKVSDRDATHIIIATAQALGHNVDNLVINRSSIRRVREKVRKLRAEQLRLSFNNDLFKEIVVHWDEKMLPSLTGKDLVERLPVLISCEGREQLLGVPQLSAGTGEEQAENVFQLLIDWEITDSVVAVCCDTTASNTGRLKGACVLLEQHLEKDMLYLMCRHHIYELVLRCVFEEKFGITSGPNIPLFKKFQEYWSKLNTSHFNAGIEDINICTALSHTKNDVLQFALDHSKKEQFREDYRELLELTIIFLGGTPHRGISFRIPGASHHARWMAKAIYCLKIFIFRNQFKMSPRQQKACQDTCIFIVSIYVKSWFRAHIAIEAPYQDLMFVQKLLEYENIDQKVAFVSLKKMCGHLWYLSPETAALAFFDINVPLSEKKKMVVALNTIDTSEYTANRFAIDIKNLSLLKSNCISDFINSSSVKLFHRFNIKTDFLNEDPVLWKSNQHYIQGLNKFINLKVVNDAAERGVKLMSDYNNLITKNEDQKQFLIQTIYDYRQRYPNANKNTLKNYI